MTIFGSKKVLYPFFSKFFLVLFRKCFGTFFDLNAKFCVHFQLFFFSVLPWYKISSLGFRNSAGNFSPSATVATGETLILHVFPEVLFHHYWPNFFRPYCFTTVDPSGGEKYYIATNMCKTAKSVNLTPFQSNSSIQTDVIGQRIDVLFF